MSSAHRDVRARPLRSSCSRWRLRRPACSTPGAGRRLAIAAASDLQTVLPEIVRGVRADAAGRGGGVVRIVGNLLRADPERCAVRRVPVGRRRLPAAAGRRPGCADAVHAAGLRDRPPGACGRAATSSIDLARGLAALTDAAGPRTWRSPIRSTRPMGGRPWRRCAARGSTTRCRRKLVMGESLAQTAQLVESGNADVGLLVAVARARPHAARPRAPTPKSPPACIRRSIRRRSW